MKPARTYLLIISLAAVLALILLRMFATTETNMEMVIINDSKQVISLMDLHTEKTGKNIRLREIKVGAEVTVKFHNDGEDTVSSMIRFSDGREMRGESISIKPGFRVTQTVTQEKISTKQDPETIRINR